VEWLNDPQIWASLLTLTALEIVLGIDNLVFITILAGRLPANRQNRARQLGWLLRWSAAWRCSAQSPGLSGSPSRFQVLDHTVSWQDLILMGAASSCSTRARARSTTGCIATLWDRHQGGWPGGVHHD